MNRTLKSIISAVSLSVLFFGTLSLPTDGFARNNNRDLNVNKNVNRNSNANVNRNSNVNVNRNSNVNVNRNSNVNVNKNVNVDVHHDNYHPVATAAAVTAAVVVTSAVVGSVVYSVPPSCVPVRMGNVTYQQCGSTWYQPQYAGSTVQYVVINPPR
jgi:hypothetical protein